MMQSVKGLAQISEQYDLFLLDLWGVVHDGTSLYPGVLGALQALKDAGKEVIFISNAPRRSHRVKTVLTQLGIDTSLYREAVSSGEVGFKWLEEGLAPWGKRYFFIGPDRDADVLHGLDYVAVDDIENADFLLNVGFGMEAQTSDDFTPLLTEASALSLPMLCLNPDLEVVKITGEHFPCAGVLGKIYEKMGCKVVWFGKPYPEIYAHCVALTHHPKTRMLAVGDSLETDIPGGQRFGIDTLLITGGILKKLSDAEVMEQCKALGLNPTYIAPSLAVIPA